MNSRSTLLARMGAFVGLTLLAVPALAGCGGTSDDSSQPSAEASSESSTQEATGVSGSSEAASPSASLTWPEGTDEFTFNVCVSQGENTIQGGGDSEDGEWNLYLDANLLEAGDTGQLMVSQLPDMAVVYEGEVTELTVDPDGSFTGSGKDAGDAPFTVTGNCDVSW